MDPRCEFLGYDIAPQAIALSQSRQNGRLRCILGDIRNDSDAGFDLLLILDVLEHQENYFSFLRDLKPLAAYKLIHTVLNLSMLAIFAKNGLTKQRDLYYDLHYFTKDMILQVLAGEGYEVIDWCYVPRAKHRSSGMAGRVKQWTRTSALRSTLTLQCACSVVTACWCWQNESKAGRKNWRLNKRSDLIPVPSAVEQVIL